MEQIRVMCLPDHIFIAARLLSGVSAQRLTFSCPYQGRMVSLFSAEALDDTTELGLWICSRFLVGATEALRRLDLDGPAEEAD